MPRISDKKAAQPAPADTSSDQETTQVQEQEEQQAADSAETSFFAADVTEGGSSAPQSKRDRSRAVGLDRPLQAKPSTLARHARNDPERRGAGHFYGADTSPERGARRAPLPPEVDELHAKLAQVEPGGADRPFASKPSTLARHARNDRERRGAGHFSATGTSPERGARQASSSPGIDELTATLEQADLRGAVRDPSLRPQLAELHAALKRLEATPDRQLLQKGFAEPLLLETLDRDLLRRAYVALRASHPASPFTTQLRVAWTARVEGKIYIAVQRLNALTQAVRELNRGVCEPEAFYALWDKQGDSLRALSSDQCLAARQGSKMGLGETYFYEECLAALNEHALEIALARRSGKVPDEGSLRRLAQRLETTAQLGDLDVRVELAQQRNLDAELSLVSEVR